MTPRTVEIKPQAAGSAGGLADAGTVSLVEAEEASEGAVPSANRILKDCT